MIRSSRMSTHKARRYTRTTCLACYLRCYKTTLFRVPQKSLSVFAILPSLPISQIRQQCPRSMLSVKVISTSALRLIGVVPCDKGYIPTI